MSKHWLAKRRDLWVDAMLAKLALPVLVLLVALIAVLPPLLTACVVGAAVLTARWSPAEKKCIFSCKANLLRQS